MKLSILAAFAALALAGCASTATQVLTNVEHCERVYDGAVSGGMTGGSFSGTVHIKCLPAVPKPDPG